MKMLDFSKIDFQKHIVQLPTGTILYRIVHPGVDLLKASGRTMRFVTEPPGFNAGGYVPGIVSAGSGVFCFSSSLETARLEAKRENNDEYQVILNEPLDAHDLDSICREQGIGDLYMQELEDKNFTQFYGTKIKSLRHKSKENPNSYNVVIFSDWFPEFNKMVTVERLTKEG